MFNVVDLQQGTNAWLAWRHDGIGGSDAPALMGQNPWRTPAALFAEKIAPPRAPFRRTAPRPAAVAAMPATALDLFGNAPPPAPARRDNGLEAQARRMYIAAHGSAVAPTCVVSTAHDWQRASLDGIDLAQARALEIKCGPATYAEVDRSGKVPAHYIGQLQHTLAVTGYTSIDFWVWHPGRPPLLITERRDEIYIAEMTSREAAFWARVLAKRASLAG